MDKERTQQIVKDAYGKIAQGQTGCGCGTSSQTEAEEFAKSLGYSAEELQNIPVEANLALSCGNPILLASLKEGETVLDLGSGAGFDCFIAAKKVGSQGKVTGVDMTPEMIAKATANAEAYKFTNVEFKLGEIENLPLAENSVDVVISNCVINLSADKQKVLQEVFRVLKPGGRAVISDIALLQAIPECIKQDKDAYTACIAGAVLVDEYRAIVEKAGLKRVAITSKKASICLAESVAGQAEEEQASCCGNDSLADYIVSIYVEGYK